MTQALNQHLYDAYDGFADKRYRKIVFDRTIAVDQHRGPTRPSGPNQSIHTMIFVAVHDGDELELSFAGNVPSSAQFDTLKGQLTRFRVDALAVACVRRLGAAARQVPVPPDNPSMHFAGREVSEDLERLASHLARYLGIP